MVQFFISFRTKLRKETKWFCQYLDQVRI